MAAYTSHSLASFFKRDFLLNGNKQYLFAVLLIQSWLLLKSTSMTFKWKQYVFRVFLNISNSRFKVTRDLEV